MKNILQRFSVVFACFASFVAPSAFGVQDTNSITIISFKVLDPPLVIRSDAPMSTNDSRALLPFVKLEFEFDKCTNWQQVLAIHTSNSIAVMDRLNMRKNFEESRALNGGTNAYEQTFTAYVHYLQGGQERMLAQSLPYVAKIEDVAKSPNFRVQGYTKVGDEWKIDKTLQTSDLAALMINSTQSQMEKIEQWVKVTGQAREP